MRTAIMVLVSILLQPLAAARADEVQTITVSPSGPVTSLSQANDLAQDGSPIVVRVQPGTYRNASVTWTHDNTMFIGVGTAIFDGQFNRAWGVISDAQHLAFINLRWTRYNQGGILLKQSTDHLIDRNIFTRIGTYYSKHSEEDYAWAGVMINDVTGLTIQRSVFADILNTGVGYTHEHGVYFVQSSSNQVKANRFVNVGGDPIRFRDGSNDNTVTGNTFTRAGSNGYVGDYACRDENHPGQCPTGDERVSWRNTFTSNTLNSPHPWHRRPFTTRFCYDRQSWCSQQRVKGQNS